MKKEVAFFSFILFFTYFFLFFLSFFVLSCGKWGIKYKMMPIIEFLFRSFLCFTSLFPFLAFLWGKWKKLKDGDSSLFFTLFFFLSFLAFCYLHSLFRSKWEKRQERLKNKSVTYSKLCKKESKRMEDSISARERKREIIIVLLYL